MSENTRVLAIYAHPDDEVLGSGATIARYVREGFPVEIAVLGEGATSRFSDRETALASKAVQKELNKLRQTVKQAAEILGVESVHTYSLPDNRFDSVDLLSIIKIVEEIKHQIQPTIVLTHHFGDLNIDHRILFEAVLTAFRSLPGEPPCIILSGEVLSATEYTLGVSGKSFEPNFWIPIEAIDLHKKVEALRIYENELRAFPHPRSVEAVEALATLRGAQCGASFAESFRLVRGWGGVPIIKN